MRISPFYITRVWVYIYIYVHTYINVYMYVCLFVDFLYHSNINTKQESSYQDIIALVLTWYRKTMTQIVDRIYKDSLTLRHPPNANIWLVLQFQHPWVNTFTPIIVMFNVWHYVFIYILAGPIDFGYDMLSSLIIKLSWVYIDEFGNVMGVAEWHSNRLSIEGPMAMITWMEPTIKMCLYLIDCCNMPPGWQRKNRCKNTWIIGR